MTLAASSFWDDWPKFVPGWLAFVATVGTWIYKAWTRRHKVALGAADDELREALEAARIRFEDIIAEGRRADWFMDEERRETARRIRDLADRRKDETLRAELTKVADAWDEAFALAPGAAGPRVRWMDQPSTPQERAESARVQEQFGKEADVSRTALEHIKAALTRLNELERRTLGRS
ncbi:hypothetical protein [Streptomyces plumbiresistens]|uniref:Uncharacterized protein n=1 Tax=Streptomyces plumbiresistens TaxID=511811 RepID=A0ABP7STK7_9ACTN